MLTIAAHTTLLRQKSAKILPSEKPGNEIFQTFKAWKKIRKLFRLTRKVKVPCASILSLYFVVFDFFSLFASIAFPILLANL